MATSRKKTARPAPLQLGPVDNGTEITLSFANLLKALDRADALAFGRGRVYSLFPDDVKKDRRAARETLRTCWSNGLIGVDQSLLAIMEEVHTYADTELPVLIVGESGTGKELAARCFHVMGKQKGELVTINCAGIPEELLESELFGSKKGAYTGAEDRPGLIETADGGTLFLDEVGEMPALLQAKLLRFLESGEYYPVGGRELQRANVRTIAATNRELDRAIKEGAFRRDLFERLAGVEIEIPPLFLRPGDLPLLLFYFINRFNQSAPSPIERIQAGYLFFVLHHRWPGNVRQLAKTVKKDCIRCCEFRELVPAFWGDIRRKRRGLDSSVFDIKNSFASDSDFLGWQGKSTDELIELKKLPTVDFKKLAGEFDRFFKPEYWGLWTYEKRVKRWEREAHSEEAPLLGPENQDAIPDPWGLPFSELRKEYVKRWMEKCGGNKSAVSKATGLSRDTIRELSCN